MGLLEERLQGKSLADYTNTQLRLALGAVLYTNTADMWKKYLNQLGYSGDVSQMLQKYYVDYSVPDVFRNYINAGMSLPAYIINDGGMLAPYVTFTRSSTATRFNSAGLLETVAANAPRYDYDPATVTRANLLRYSQEFDNAAHAKVNSSITANAATAPDGTLTADLLLDNATSGGHSVQPPLTAVTAGITYTYSIYAKAGTASRIMVYGLSGVGGRGVGVDLSNGSTFTVNTITLETGAVVTSVGNGWYRISIPVTPISTATSALGATYLVSGTAFSYSGTGTGVYVWGVQLETGPTATEYIPTTASPAGDATLRGLLIEEQRTNFYNSSNSYTAGTGTTVTASAAVSPDGTLTASRFAKTDATTPRYQASATTMTVSANTAYTVSRCFKYDGSDTTVSLEYNNADNWGAVAWVALFNVTSSGVTVSSQQSCTASVQNLGNGWYRAIATITTAATIGSPTNPQTLTRITGASGVSVLMCHAQLEAGAFATSYIPTTTAAVTRAMDDAAVLSISSVGYNSLEGTLFAEYTPNAPTFIAPSAGSFIGVGGNGFNLSGAGISRWWNGSTNIATANSVAIGLSRKEAFSFTVSGGRSICLAGGAVASDSAAPWLSGSPTGLRLGVAGGIMGSQSISGHIRRFRFYPRRLSNAQLQVITA